MLQADASKVSKRAKKRGIPQLGTLGAGNHYCEIQVIWFDLLILFLDKFILFYFVLFYFILLLRNTGEKNKHITSVFFYFVLCCFVFV